MDTAGYRGGSILQGLGRWPIVGLFCTPDLLLGKMLLKQIKIMITIIIKIIIIIIVIIIIIIIIM